MEITLIKSFCHADMDTYIFITNSYYPKPMANGVCVHALAKECVKRGKDVHVVCYGQEGEPKNDFLDNIAVHRIQLPRYRNWCSRSAKTGVGKILWYIGRLISLSKKLYNIKRYPLQDRIVVNRISKTCLKLLNDNEACIIASYTPVEAIYSSLLIKKRKPNSKIVYYSLDTLSNESGWGILPEKKRREYGISHEKFFFNSFDIVLLMECHRDFYSHSEILNGLNNYMFTNFPLFEPRSLVSYKKEVKRILYAGSFYRFIRNPKTALEILAPFLNDYYLDIYGEGDCDDIINHYAGLFPGHIIQHGRQRHETVVRAMEKATILLSIGNTGTEMAPSKIFEYFSFGLPIIHVYSNDRDPCLPLLKTYGNAICVNEKSSMIELQHFLGNVSVLSTGQLTQLFMEATPSYTIDLIEKRFG